MYNAYLAWKRVCLTGGSEFHFCRKNFLSQQVLSNIEDLKGQLVVCLVDSGFLPLTEAERAALSRYVLTTIFAQTLLTPQNTLLQSTSAIL